MMGTRTPGTCGPAATSAYSPWCSSANEKAQGCSKLERSLWKEGAGPFGDPNHYCTSPRGDLQPWSPIELSLGSPRSRSRFVAGWPCCSHRVQAEESEFLMLNHRAVEFSRVVSEVWKAFTSFPSAKVAGYWFCAKANKKINLDFLQRGY